MKIGFFHTMLRLLFCALVLFPDFCMAGTVRVPGYYGGAVTTPQTVQTTMRANIPGFYNGRQLPTVSSDKIPELKGVIQGAADPNGWTQTTNAQGGNDLTISQTQSQAIIDWWTFNIGDKSSVYFNQQGNSSWIALNRIWDSNPSQILGALRADGKVFLINQNGILFWPGAKVNVNSLIASALNITNQDFLNNTLHFYQETGQIITNDYYLDANGHQIPYSYNGMPYAASAIVSNHGEMNAAQGGYVFLLVPTWKTTASSTLPLGKLAWLRGQRY